MSVKCKCKGDICKGEIWIEEDSYIWVKFADTRDNDKEREVQVINGASVETLIEIRDMLNNAIRRKAGLDERY